MLGIQTTADGPLICHLFRLTPELEEAFEVERNHWLDQPENWAQLFMQALSVSIEQWPQVLVDVAGLPTSWLAWASQQSPQTPKALQIPETTSVDSETLYQLAAGFLISSPGQLIVPYLRVQT